MTWYSFYLYCTFISILLQFFLSWCPNGEFLLCHNYRHWSKCHSPSITVSGCDTMVRHLFTSTHSMSTYHTKKKTKLQPNIQHGKTYSYHRKKFISACLHSSAHVYGETVRGGNFKHYITTAGPSMIEMVAN